MTADQPHYTLKQIAEQWHTHESTVYRIFRREPDVLRLGETGANRKVRVGLRIPQHVRDRVYNRMTHKEAA